MYRSALIRTLAPGLALILLAGCLTTPTVAPMRYFTLNPVLAPAQATPTGKSLGIRPLIGARPYKLEIAYTAESNRLAYYQRAEWAEPPAIVVNRALTDGLKALGYFNDVGEAADMTRPDYILTGELRRFEADFTGNAPRVVVEVDLAIREQGGPGSLWQGQLIAEQAIEGLDTSLPSSDSDTQLAAIAAAMSQAVASVVNQVCAALAS